VQQLEFIKMASLAHKSQTTGALKCHSPSCYLRVIVMRYVLFSLPKIAVNMRSNELLVISTQTLSPVICLHPRQFRVGYYGNKSNTARTFGIIESNIYSVQDPCWQGVISWTTLSCLSTLTAEHSGIVSMAVITSCGDVLMCCCK